MTETDSDEMIGAAISVFYRHILKREAHVGERDHWTARVHEGFGLSDIANRIGASEEVRVRREREVGANERGVQYIYETMLYREARESEVETWQTAFEKGLPFSEFMLAIARSDEAVEKARASHAANPAAYLPITSSAEAASPVPAAPAKLAGTETPHLSECIKIVYRRIVGREAGPDDIRAWAGAMAHGLSVDEFVCILEGSDEAKQNREREAPGLGRTDGEFIVGASELIYDRGVTPPEVDHWKRFLAAGGGRRAAFVNGAINAHLAAIYDDPRPDAVEHDNSRCWIMGTDKTITKADWDRRRASLNIAENRDPVPPPAMRHSGEYDISIITSMYKGSRFIRKFLDNICAQTAFDRAELIIIDANSPDGEADIIEEYREQFENIVYHRANYRIGIYDAWNVGVEMSRGRHLTNANLDDLRRADSIQLQSAFLDEHAEVDVAYQDLFYSLDPSLHFEEVAQFGFKTNLPPVTPHSLLNFNSPHNAPMWRKVLHQRFGLFDVSYKSAGDWEFWLRCIQGGARFGKINTPHVVYYHNPDGISTSADTPGVVEARRTLKKYSRRLINQNLLLTGADFGAKTGAGLDEDETTPLYDQAQKALTHLGARRNALIRPGKIAQSRDRALAASGGGQQ